MRILSIVNFPYFERSGGQAYLRESYRMLRASGCAVLAAHTSSNYDEGDEAAAEHPSEAWISSQGADEVRISAPPDRELRFSHNGVPVLQAIDSVQLADRLERLIGEFQPDYVQLYAHNSEVLSRRALDLMPERVVITCHASIFLPWDCGFADKLRRARAVWVPSIYLANVLSERSGVAATVVQLPLFGEALSAESESGRREGLVLTINPGLWKGFPIVEGLAQQNPDTRFGVVSTWNVTDDLRCRLVALENVEEIPSVPRERMDEIYDRAAVLLVPSLVPEAFSLVIVEAMLRGIPVLASDLGGCPEAKLGVPYVLPVTPLDLETGTVPPQDLRPWIQALRALLDDEDHYRDVAEEARRAATRFVGGLRESSLAKFFRSLPG